MAQSEDDTTSEPLHLAIVGGGIAGCAAAVWAAAYGGRVTLFNAGLPLGGTCIHTGTFPARMTMAAATDHHRATHPRFDGINVEANRPDFSKLQKQHRRTGEQIQRRLHDRLDNNPNVEVVEQKASFRDETTLVAGGDTYQPDRVLLTPGSHSTPPEIRGLDQVSTMGLNQIAGLDELPDQIVFVGCNYVSLAYAQAMARFGTEVVVLTERPSIIGDDHGDDVTAAFTDVLVDDGTEVVTGVDLSVIQPEQDQIVIEGQLEGQSHTWSARRVVIVDHRRPTIDDLNLDAAGVELTDNGYIVIDESLQTTNPRVFAAGDAIGRREHAYAAAYDATLAARNAVCPSRTAGHPTAVPFAIYTDPQFAGVGYTEPQARDAGFSTDVATCSLDDIPAGAATGYTGGLFKLIRDRRSDHLVGARVIAPQASELIMQLALAVRYGLTASDLASLVHPPISVGQAIVHAARQFTDQPPDATGEATGPPAGT